MNLLNPPEIADGGYWYAIQVDSGGIPMTAIPGPGWVCWHSDGLGALRTPKAVAGIVIADANISSILLSVGEATKPHGRIGAL
jgi:hypothetical protein